MTMTRLVSTTLRLSWVIAILLIIACAAPPQSKDEATVYRGEVSDSEYYAMVQKEQEARQKEAEMRKYVDLIQERSDMSIRIIFGMAGFLGTLIIFLLSILFPSIRNLNRTTATLVQQVKDKDLWCKLMHENVDKKFDHIENQLNHKK